MVSKEQSYGELVSAQIVVQVSAPAGERWIATDEMLEPSSPSEAVAWTVTVPRRYAPGSTMEVERLNAVEEPKMFPGFRLTAVNAAPEKPTPATTSAVTASRATRARVLTRPPPAWRRAGVR